MGCYEPIRFKHFVIDTINFRITIQKRLIGNKHQSPYFHTLSLIFGLRLNFCRGTFQKNILNDIKLCDMLWSCAMVRD